jgi:predicted DNA-binding transcriptional regulator AlpA
MDDALSYPLRKWCKLVGISVSTGYNLINAKKLKVIKVGKKTFVSRQESDRILREGL